MTKGFEYPFLENCKDIVNYLKGSEIDLDKKSSIAAQYIIDCLTQKKET